MGRKDQTDMGGLQGAFLTTHWSLIEGIREHQDKDRSLIGLLLECYWKPVYCYLRRKGYPNEEAKDLTQAFFHEIVLSRPLVSLAVIINLIASTRTEGGLRVRCELDKGRYPKGQQVSDEQMAQIRLGSHRFHGDWNYTIHPQRKK